MQSCRARRWAAIVVAVAVTAVGTVTVLVAGMVLVAAVVMVAVMAMVESWWTRRRGRHKSSNANRDPPPGRSWLRHRAGSGIPIPWRGTASTALGLL